MYSELKDDVKSKGEEDRGSGPTKSLDKDGDEKGENLNRET